VSPLQETIRIALSLSDNQIALMQGPALALPMLLAAAPIGLAIDRYTRVRLLLFFSVLGVLGSALTAMASGIATLFIGRALAGLAAPATVITASSLIGDLYAPAQRGRANMIVAVGQVAGMSAAFALGGKLLAMFGTDSDGWRFAMWWLAAPLLLVVCALMAMREPPRTSLVRSSLSVTNAFTALGHYRSVIAPLMVGVVLVGIADGAALIWAAPVFARQFALSPDRIGAIVGAALLVSGIFGPIAGGLLADFCQRSGGPRRTVTALSVLAMLGIPAGLFAFAPSATLAGVLFAVFITIGAGVSVMVTTLCTVVIPNELRGLCMALLFAASLLFGLGLAPLTVSLISGALGGPAAIGHALACVCVLSSACGVFAFAYGKRAGDW
jgi:MFS family permease